MNDKKIDSKKQKDFNKKQKNQQKDSKEIKELKDQKESKDSKEQKDLKELKDVNQQETQQQQQQQETTPIYTERLKTALNRNQSATELRSQSPTPITVDTSAPNYNSKMLLAVLQNRKNQMLEGKRVLCTERVIPAEDIKRHTQGFIIVPRDQWENITPGSYIIYMGYDNNYRNGGYIKYKYEKNNVRYFQIETKQGRKNNDPSYISFPVSYDEIKTLFKKIDPSAIVEINLIKKDLANKRDNIEYLNKKIMEETQARKNLESKIEHLEKENKKIKTLLKMMMNSIEKH